MITASLCDNFVHVFSVPTNAGRLFLVSGGYFVWHVRVINFN
jgi:hypothetical protein